MQEKKIRKAMAKNQFSAASIASQAAQAATNGVSGMTRSLPKSIGDFSPSLQRLYQSQLFGKNNGSVSMTDILTDVAAQVLVNTLNIKPKNNSPSLVQAPYAPDRRAKLSLSPKAGAIMYNDLGGVLEPLRATNGLLFPYSPTINASHSAEYEGQSLAHTNYAQQSYSRSSADILNVVGDFTAETQEEGRYLLACIHFLKSVTKMFYGLDDNRGTPPPVLRFSAYGEHMYNSLPVVVQSTNFDFPNNVDYMAVEQPGGGITDVPTQMQINVQLLVMISRTRTTEFSLKDYAQGKLIGDPNGKGGFS